MNPSPHIGVLGGTGTVGRELLAALGGDQLHTAFARSDASAATLRASGAADVRNADLAEPGSLARAFDGIDALFLLTPPGPRQPELEANALDAAEQAGVRRIVYLSLYDPSGPTDITLRAWHVATEERLATSDVSWAVLQPPIYSSNLAAQVATLEQGLLVWPGRDGALSFVDPRDVAAVAAHALRDDGVSGVLTFTGPEALSFFDVADRLSRHLGRAITYVDVAPDDFLAGLAAGGVDPAYAAALVEAADCYASHPQPVDTARIEEAADRPALPVDAVIERLIVPALLRT